MKTALHILMVLFDFKKYSIILYLTAASALAAENNRAAWPATQPALTGKTYKQVIYNRVQENGDRIIFEDKGYELKHEWKRGASTGSWWSDAILKQEFKAGGWRLLSRSIGPNVRFHDPIAIIAEGDLIVSCSVEGSEVRVVIYTASLSTFYAEPDTRFDVRHREDPPPEKPRPPAHYQVVHKVANQNGPYLINSHVIKARFKGALADNDLTLTLEMPIGRKKFACRVEQKEGEPTYRWEEISSESMTESEMKQRRQATQPSWREP